MDTYAGSSGQDGEARGERPRAVLMRGRERVRDVLEPHLGPIHALERANNIAQALAPEDAQPELVAFEMLRQLPGQERRELAAAVRRAWLAAEYDELLVRRAFLTGEGTRPPRSAGRAVGIPSAGDREVRCAHEGS